MKRSDPDLSVERRHALEKSHAFCNTFFSVGLIALSAMDFLKGPRNEPEPPAIVSEAVEEEVEALEVTISMLPPPGTPMGPSVPDPVDAVAITPTPIKMPGVYASRATGVRGAKIGAYGVFQTEALVYGFLRYLAMTQNPDGSWDSGELSTEATSLALLCFLAHGELPGQSEEFGDTVEKAIRWLRPL